MKKVSVVMCTYNGARYIREQIESLLRQTYPLHEIIVQDDGSTDGTCDIVSEYAAQNPVIRLIHNDGAHGINNNFFSALHKAEGEFIAIADQDDIWEPEKIEWQMQAIGSHLLCSGQSKPFSSDGFPVIWDSRKPNYHILRLCYLGELAGHTMLINRKILDYLGEKPKYKYMYDWQLQMIAAANNDIVYINKVLVNFRRHADASTATKPTSSKFGLKKELSTMLMLIVHRRALKRHIIERFSAIEEMLSALPFNTADKMTAIEMAHYQQKKGLFNMIKFAFFCVKHRNHLFHTEEKRHLVAIARALYYPVYCGYYYRGILKDNQK